MIAIGLWNFDAIDGGILKASFPSHKEEKENKSFKIKAKSFISDKIKQLILATISSNQFNNDWSLSPITLENSHYYLYGFFAMDWHVISIRLPIEFSFWLIESKSNLIIFESIIKIEQFSYLPQDQWKYAVLEPLYQRYNSALTAWKEKQAESKHLADEESSENSENSEN